MTDVYSYGLPFSEKLGENIDDLMKRILKKKASLIIIDGQMGEGKTTLAVQIGQYIERVQKEGKGFDNLYSSWIFDWDNELALGGVEFQDKLQICADKKLHVVIYDEAGDFNKRGAITEFNQMLNRIFQTFRAYKILVICCLPCFDILDKDLFKQGIPRLLINCHDRDDFDGSFRGYDLDSMFYLKKYMHDLPNPLKAYQMVSPNFRGHFKDLPPALSQKLESLSMKGKREILSGSIIKSKGLISVKELARKLNRSVLWVRLKLKKLKIKPEKTYKLINYYNEDIFILLEGEVKR
jgi:hypothetical protein